MSLLQITAYIKHLMLIGNIEELEKCLCRLKNRLGDLVKPEVDLLAIGKKDSLAGSLWIERNAGDFEGAEGRYPSRYIILLTLWLEIYGLKGMQGTVRAQREDFLPGI